MFTNVLASHCTSDHHTLLVCKVSDRIIPPTVFEILKFKLKNENKNNAEIDFLLYLPC